MDTAEPSIQCQYLHKHIDFFDVLNLTRLRVLAAVAEHGSVTSAAEALHYAQPSVSHHLNRLEAETGAVLVRRVGRGIALTEAGRQLAGRATEILGRVDAAEAELAELTGLRAGRVRLAAFPSALGTVIPAAAARLRAAHPDLTLELTEVEPPGALDLLRAGEVDAAIVFRYQADPDESDLRLDRLKDEALHLVGPPEPELAGHAGWARRRGLDCRLPAVPCAPTAAVRGGRVRPANPIHHR